ncbi:uroporphyrinogen-III synthase [Sphingomonas jatrophae]|uniref:Uroporphyrinogen-III synthase n=1 Tax=Sphingomonas jatrophae TaxID=1166337 RepID=A0A1I6M8K5_9SPHN|nr:uroporphyrinogen-III synthase [Sphingomonas jatrophae]SFS11987.1 uroporphyrinogen-III synthase [Sphingomonas jatrophae]
MKLLVLRPEPGASATVARAHALGMAAEAHPLFAVRALDWSLPDESFDALLVTSANAMRHGGPLLRRLHALPLYAVGEATARAAREAGFGTIVAGEGDAAAILARAVADGQTKLLHLVGREHKAVEQAGVRIVRLPVYAAEETGTKVPEGEAIALVHSPRAARLLAARVTDPARLRLAAISPAAAAAAGPGWAASRIAAAPNDDALLAAAASLCEEERGERA